MQRSRNNQARNGKKKNKKRQQPLPRVNRALALPGASVRGETIADIVFTRRDIINNIGSANANEVFLVTDPSNIDIADKGTSQSLPFWNSYQQQYRQARVMSAHIEVDFSNHEPGPAAVTITPVNKAYSKNDAAYDIILDQPMTKRRMLGPLTGNGITRIVDLQYTSSLGGAPDIRALDFYVGNTDVAGARTTNNWYFVVGASLSGAVFSVGVEFILKIIMRVRFFEIGTPSN